VRVCYQKGILKTKGHKQKMKRHLPAYNVTLKSNTNKWKQTQRICIRNLVHVKSVRGKSSMHPLHPSGIKIRKFYKDTLCLPRRIFGINAQTHKNEWRSHKIFNKSFTKIFFRNKVISATNPPPRRQKIFGQCIILGVKKNFSEQ
jgi:hypothetical protein